MNCVFVHHWVFVHLDRCNRQTFTLCLQASAYIHHGFDQLLLLLHLHLHSHLANFFLLFVFLQLFV